MLMLRMIAVTALLACVLALSASAAWSHTWVWNADNATGSGNDFRSNWADGVNQFYPVAMSGSWAWTFETFQPSTVSLNWNNSSGRGLLRTNFVGGVKDPMSSEYLNMYTGITLKARTWIPSDAASGNGNILIGVTNDSTAGLDIGNGFQMYWGWDHYGDAIGVSAWNSNGSQMRPWIIPSSPYADAWSEWIIGVKRIGNQIGWKVWLNGELLGATYELGGEYWSYVGGQGTTSDPYIYLGQRRSQGFAHITHYDQVTFSNVGIVPEPSCLFALASGFAGLAGFAIRRRR